jgi:predicted Co/Zn/Cd cation transporter (cation efflux family)
MDSKNVLSIWLVVGVSLLVNGVLILGAGLYELVYPPVDKVVLYQYHASIWWGAILAVVGAIYCYKFSPFRKKAERTEAATAVREEIHVH